MIVGVSILADSQSPESFEPTDGPFYHPADAAQVAAVLRLATTDEWLDTQHSQHGTRPVTVVSGIGQKRLRMPPRSATRASNLRKADHRRQNLAMIADVGCDRLHGQWHASGIEQQGVFGAEFPAIDGVGPAAIATPESPHLNGIDDGCFEFENTAPFQFLQQALMNLLPDPGFLPALQSQARGFSAAAHFRKYVFPATADGQHIPDHLEHHPPRSYRSYRADTRCPNG